MSDNNHSNLDNIPFELFAFAAFIGLLALAGYFYPILWKGPWALFRYCEINTILFLFPLPSSLESELSGVIFALDNKPWGSLNYTGMMTVDRMMLTITGWVYIVIFMAFIINKLRLPTYTKHLNYEQLLSELSKHYRFARCMIKLNPLKEMKEIDVTKSAFAIKKSPKLFMTEIGATSTLRIPGSSIKYTYINKDIAHNKMLKQLGRRHKDWTTYTDYEKWIVAAFMCYLAAKKFDDTNHQMGDEILGDASYHFNGEQFSHKQVTNKAEKAIAMHCELPVIKNIGHSHAFTNTVIRQLFHMSKTKGVHPAFHFSWLYTVDRTLALVLNETGMPNERGGGIEVGPPESCIEALYTRAHWINEVKTGGKLLSPSCRYTLDDVEDYMVRMYGYKREEDINEMIAGLDDPEITILQAT